MVAIDGYCIDRYEAHIVVRSENGNFIDHPPYERPPRNQHYLARSQKGVRPQAHINRREATTACENAGKRLCSLGEWYHACRGKRDTRYPYGQEYVSGACNVGKAHLLTRLFGSNAKAWKMDTHFNSPLLNQQPGYLAPSGQYEHCASDLGTFDMVGNLHEWVSDSVDPSLEDKLPLLDGIRTAARRHRGHGIFMGGFYSTGNQHGYGCEFITVGHDPSYYDYSTGFRCCQEQTD